TGINMLPGGASADAIERGEYVEATISFIGDVALLGATRVRGAVGGTAALNGAAKVQRLSELRRATIGFAAVEGSIGVYRIGQAGYAVMEGENGKAATYLGEAILRIVGTQYTRTQLDDIASAKRLAAQNNVGRAWSKLDYDEWLSKLETKPAPTTRPGE